MRKAQRARDVLREIPIDDLIARVGKAGELYANAELPMGDGTQTPGCSSCTRSRRAPACPNDCAART